MGSAESGAPPALHRCRLPGGGWGSGLLDPARIDAAPDAARTLDYTTAKLFLVLGGEGTATVTADGAMHQIDISGAPTLYQLRDGPAGRSQLELALDEGMSAFAFTFG